MTKYIDDNIEHIESDIEKVQTKPNMYISYLGEKGAFHLCKEIINNAIDECINPKSPGRIISVVIDEIENTLTVTDDGRGIPFNDIEKVCSYLQSGSKFQRDNGTSAGENGVGITATNALSESFSITSMRDGKKGIMRWREGKLCGKLKETKLLNRRGTAVSFKPSEFFLGKCTIPSDQLYEWTEKISYLIPAGITINFSIQKAGKESTVQKKFKNKDGLLDYLKVIEPKPISEPVRLNASSELIENNRNKERSRKLDLDIAFSYSSKLDDEFCDSFCNYINTIDKGVHYDAVRQALVQFLVRVTKDNMSDREKKRLEVISNDCSGGLVLLINLTTDMQPHFAFDWSN